MVLPPDTVIFPSALVSRALPVGGLFATAPRGSARCRTGKVDLPGHAVHLEGCDRRLASHGFYRKAEPRQLVGESEGHGPGSFVSTSGVWTVCCAVIKSVPCVASKLVMVIVPFTAHAAFTPVPSLSVEG